VSAVTDKPMRRFQKCHAVYIGTARPLYVVICLLIACHVTNTSSLTIRLTE